MSGASETLCPECGAPNAAGDASSCAQCGAALLLEGRYRLRGVLGANVGTTYLGYDEREARDVVVKELVFARLDAWKTQELFEREAAVLRQLEHPRIPRCFDAFSLGQGKKLRSYLVQERLVGRDLRAEMEGRRYSEGEVLGVLDEIFEILEYLQALRPPLIHRDLKPSNLLRLRDGHLALIDFGSVRDLVAPDPTNATVAGTFGFMAPEQFQGEASLETDLYGAGAVAVALLSRVSPAKMSPSGVALDWRPHVDVSSPMEALLSDLLAPERRDRPHDARAARARVREVREALRRPKVSAVERERSDLQAPTPAPRRKMPQWLSAVVAAIVVAAGILLFERTATRTSSSAGPASVSGASRAEPGSNEPPNSASPTGPASRPAPTAPVEAALAQPLAPKEMTAILVAAEWRGAIGRLRFSPKGDGLDAVVRTVSSEYRFDRVTLGPLATLTLERARTIDGVLERDIYHGALSRDRSAIAGTHERRYGDDPAAQRVEGRWRVNAVARLPEPPKTTRR